MVDALEMKQNITDLIMKRHRCGYGASAVFQNGLHELKRLLQIQKRSDFFAGTRVPTLCFFRMDA